MKVKELKEIINSLPDEYFIGTEVQYCGEPVYRIFKEVGINMKYKKVIFR